MKSVLRKFSSLSITRDPVTVDEWISCKGPEKFYRKYINNYVSVGMEYKIKYEKLCNDLGKYVIDDSNGTIDLAYAHLEDYIQNTGIFYKKDRDSVGVHIEMEYKDNKYKKQYVIINPSRVKKLIRRFSN